MGASPSVPGRGEQSEQEAHAGGDAQRLPGVLVQVVLGGLAGRLALVAQAVLAVLEQVLGALDVGVDAVAQFLRLAAGAAGGLLEQALGVADQGLKLARDGALHVMQVAPVHVLVERTAAARLPPAAETAHARGAAGGTRRAGRAGGASGTRGAAGSEGFERIVGSHARSPGRVELPFRAPCRRKVPCRRWRAREYTARS